MIVESPPCSRVSRPGETELFLTGPVFIELLQETLAKGVPFTFRARGSSMHPFIKDGDLITVSPLLREYLPAVGDVVAFIQREAETLVVHRVIAIKSNCYVTKGDGTTGVGDGPVSAPDLLGLVTKVERNGKRVFIGLGLERRLIARLTGMELMIPLVRAVSKLLRFIRTMTMVMHVSFQRRVTLEDTVAKQLKE
jgi:signal peptidase